MFKTFTKNKKDMNIFELISIMIITAYANLEDKLRLIFSLFDFDSSMAIDMDELIFLIRNLLVGYGKLTNT